jgi:cytochrome c1
VRGIVPLLLVAACAEPEVPREQQILGAVPDRGRELAAAYGCGVCHIIPGVPGARGTVGPSLEAFGERNLIGGVAPNRPDRLVSWLENPPAVSPNTGMPAMGLTTAEARDVAAYLYTLR